MDMLILILVFIYLIIATYSDLKTKEIPDFLSYSFISIGIFVNSIKTLITKDNSFLLLSLITLGFFFLIGLVMYYTRQWGGGDSKVLIGLGALIPVYPQIILDNFSIKTSRYFGLDLFLNILIIWTIYVLIIALFLIFKNRKRFTIEFKKMYSKKNVKEYERITWGIIILMNILSLVFLKNNLQKMMVLSLSIVFLFFHYLIISIRSIEKVCIYKEVPVTKLRPGDYITKELKVEDKLIFKPIVHGVNKEQIEEIRKNFKKVEIMDGIAGIPAFLIAMIITLIKGSIILNILS